MGKVELHKHLSYGCKLSMNTFAKNPEHRVLANIKLFIDELAQEARTAYKAKGKNYGFPKGPASETESEQKFQSWKSSGTGKRNKYYQGFVSEQGKAHGRGALIKQGGSLSIGWWNNGVPHGQMLSFEEDGVIGLTTYNNGDLDG